MVALLLGVSYLAAGVIGFTVTGFTGFVAETDEQFLGFFDLNIFHNIVHLAIGLGLIIAAQMRDVTITQGVLIGVGLFYALAAVLGFLNYLQLISINDSLSFDNFFHLLSGAIALIFGLIGVRQQDDSVRHTGTAVGPGGTRPIEERRAAWDREGTYREETY
ncbi:MAG: DUF4383 domain-containing protein [Actinomycetota bacterium]|nr:DUF4383 domain-containing protein [Actinomycetota bacterium]